MALLSSEPRSWRGWLWRLGVWIAITVATVVTAHGTQARIASGITLGVAVLGVAMLGRPQRAVRMTGVLVATGCALAASLIAQNGLAEIPLLVAAARASDAFSGLGLQVFTALDALAFAALIGYLTRSPFGLLAGIGVPLLVQRTVQNRDLVRARDRAQALLAEVQAGRDAEAQAAALRERSRIARDMHDVLAHSLAGLSVQLQAARTLAARSGVDGEVLDPLDKAAALARDGMAEARAAVSALRDPVGLGLDALPALVERHPAATSLTVDGTPGTISPEAGHAAYRAVQEALTNAARYAPGAAVQVALSWSDETLRVLVTDTGIAADRQAVTGQGTGLGLAGMDERVRGVGGTLRAGPEPGGGWQVDIRVPVG